MISDGCSAVIQALNKIRKGLDNNRALQFFNLSRFSANFLAGWLLVKAGLPIEEVAVYETLLFLGNLLTFFWHGGGQNALLSYFPGLEEHQREKLLYNVFACFCILALISAGVLWAGAGFFARQFQLSSTSAYWPWLCVYITLNIPAFLTHIFFLLGQEPLRIVRYAAWSFGVQVFLVALPAFLGMGVVYVFMGLAAWALVRFLYALRILVRRAVLSLDTRLIRRWFLAAVPLSLHLLVGNGVEYVDGWIVNRYFSEPGAFAIFRYGARELPLVNLLVGALVTSSIPLLSDNREQGVIFLRERTLALARWMYPLSIILLFLSPILYKWVYDTRFLESAGIFNIYLLIIAFRLLLPQVVLIGAGKRYFLVVSALLETTLNIALSLWWMEPFGLRGIAAATIVANALNKALLGGYCWLKLRISPAHYIPWKPLLVYNLLLGAAFYLSLQLDLIPTDF